MSFDKRTMLEIVENKHRAHERCVHAARMLHKREAKLREVDSLECTRTVFGTKFAFIDSVHRISSHQI